MSPEPPKAAVSQSPGITPECHSLSSPTITVSTWRNKTGAKRFRATTVGVDLRLGIGCRVQTMELGVGKRKHKNKTKTERVYMAYQVHYSLSGTYKTGSVCRLAGTICRCNVAVVVVIVQKGVQSTTGEKGRRVDS